MRKTETDGRAAFAVSPGAITGYNDEYLLLGIAGTKFCDLQYNMVLQYFLSYFMIQ